MASKPHSRLIAPLFAAAASLVCFPAPAGAQTAAGWSKAEAILGGTPSALQAILAQQQGLSVSEPTPRPASYSVARPVPEMLRKAVRSTSASSRNPDVFGSVALKVASTRLDARWHRVDRAGVGGAAASFAHSIDDLDPVARLEAVNRYVNRRVAFQDDIKQHGRADVWSAAADTLSRGRGDCEDYAIAKLQILRKAGFRDSDLYLTIVKDLVTRADHAVLVARAEGGMYVLDNGTEELLDSDTVRDYRPILTFAAAGTTWTHGYRVESKPMDIASTDRDVAPVAPAADGQRSWSASLLALSTGFSK